MKSKSDFPNLNVKNPDGIGPDGRPYRVMVVDDKEFQRKQIAQILESEKYTIVATASNGREALDKYDKLKGKVDIITTDLDMPVLDGYALVYELNQRNQHPKVVFISEDTTKGVMQDLISMGIADFILKPVNRRILLERIKAIASKIQRDLNGV
jgi:two-component system chemotaxis response regulator CheY